MVNTQATDRQGAPRAARGLSPSSPRSVPLPGVSSRGAETMEKNQKKPKQETCELCRVLADLLRQLDSDKYQYGAEREVGLAVETALDLHKKRTH
jgi:hypothetical protein